MRREYPVRHEVADGGFLFFPALNPQFIENYLHIARAYTGWLMW